MQIRNTKLVFDDISKTANRRPACQQYMEGWTRRGFVRFARNSLITIAGFSLGLTKWGPRIAAAADTNEALKVPLNLKGEDRENWVKIQKIKWQADDPETTDWLLSFVGSFMPDEVALAVAEALSLRADLRVFTALSNILGWFEWARPNGIIRNEARTHIAKVMVMHYAIYPPARKEIISYLVTSIPLAKGLDKSNDFSYWQGFSSAAFIGNESLQALIERVQYLRGANSDGTEIHLVRYAQPLIEDLLPGFDLTIRHGHDLYQSFQARRKRNYRVPYKNRQEVTDKDIVDAEKAILNPSPGCMNLEDAVAVLLERSQFTREQKYHVRLVEFLHDGNIGNKAKRAIIAAFGNDPEMPEDVRKILLDIIAHGDEALVVGAAKALRWKNSVPVEPLVKRWLATSKDEIKFELENALASIPDPRVTPVLAKAIIGMKAESNIIRFQRRIDNFKLWYVLLGSDRDGILTAVSKYLTPNRLNDLIGWFRDTASFRFFISPIYIGSGWLSRNKGYMEDSEIAAKLVPQKIRETLSAVSQNDHLASLSFSAAGGLAQSAAATHGYFTSTLHMSDKSI